MLVEIGDQQQSPKERDVFRLLVLPASFFSDNFCKTQLCLAMFAFNKVFGVVSIWPSGKQSRTAKRLAIDATRRIVTQVVTNMLQ